MKDPNNPPMWFVIAFSAVFVPAGFIGAMMVFGMMVDGMAEYKTELSRCQKHADTPYEYHQCR